MFNDSHIPRVIYLSFKTPDFNCGARVPYSFGSIVLDIKDYHLSSNWFKSPFNLLVIV